jgi:hypothetical protein
MTENYHVQPSDRLFRWLHPGQFQWSENRPTSANFRDNYMSVDIARLTTLPESYERAQKLGKNAVASFEAKVAFDFEKEQKIHHCPTQVCEVNDEFVCKTDTGCRAYKEDSSSRKLICTNTAHGCVVGDKKKFAKQLAKVCKVEIFPPESASL